MLEQQITPALIQLLPKDIGQQSKNNAIEKAAEDFFGFTTGRIIEGKIFQVADYIEYEQLEAFSSHALFDAGLWDVSLNNMCLPQGFQSYLIVSKRPGVTDDEGAAAQRVLADYLGQAFNEIEQVVFTQEIYFFEKALDFESLEHFGSQYLGNPLINEFKAGMNEIRLDYLNTFSAKVHAHVESISLDLTDEELKSLSDQMHLALNLDEMKVIRDYFRKESVQYERKQKGLGDSPTDCELEILAQTWSEHCKHKEFNARIQYYDRDTGEQRVIDSLFKSKIRKATAVIQEKLKSAGQDWLVKVFSDNAGLVKVGNNQLLAWKVETHNTPSALDPYGGAITGILGCNRDALGTGIGGAKALFNTNVLCFGPPDYSKPLLKGQLHPARIMKGVVEGIMDGGNKLGIPTVNGSIVFDERYAGKPLVFCGTGALMTTQVNGHDSSEKPIAFGDLIIMAGGRVGKDGIHGATLSSAQAHEGTPQTIVQIGSPVTQKLLFDFLEEACKKGFVKTCTDNGAGGLSSSIGEMAELVGGAEVYLEKVPLKYSGLQPWEIFLSESQERMTLVVDPAQLEQLEALAESYEVEISNIGRFVNTGALEIRYDGRIIALLDLEFLHEGVPQKTLEAEWKTPLLKEPVLDEINDYNSIVLALLGSLNICSRESVIRRYDHEVKGKTVIKPLMGDAPQDAGLIRLNHDSYSALAVSNGIIPRYGDIDAYHMSAGAFDEAVRQIVAIGGALPTFDERLSSVWSVNDNFCVPDSVYDAEKNPDGKYKLAQLVRMCDALYDMSVAYGIPMTSGKDSMKNDFRVGDVKISVPPTVLYSMVASVEDIRQTTTSEFKANGDLIYLIGQTYDELGGSEFYKLFNQLGANVPKVRIDEAKKLYSKVYQLHQRSLIESCHDLSDGGLIIALAESCFGGELGADVTLYSKQLSLNTLLFSESHSRFLVSVRPENQKSFESHMQMDAVLLGTVNNTGQMTVTTNGRTVIDLGIEDMLSSWKGGLSL